MYYIIDTETSGSSKEDKIISLAIGEYKDHHLYNLRLELFNPGVQIKDGSRWVHNISNSMVKDKKRFRETEIYKDLKKIFSNRQNVIIGHAIENDLFMIAKDGIECNCSILDTELCVRKILNMNKSSLRYLKHELRLDSRLLENFTAHTADGDVMITYLVLLELLKHQRIEELVKISMEHSLSKKLPGLRYSKMNVPEVIKIDRAFVKEIFLTTTNPSLRYCINYYMSKHKIKGVIR